MFSGVVAHGIAPLLAVLTLPHTGSQLSGAGFCTGFWIVQGEIRIACSPPPASGVFRR